MVIGISQEGGKVIMTDQEINEAVARKLGWTALKVINHLGLRDEFVGIPPKDQWSKHYIDPSKLKDRIPLCSVPDFVNRIEAAWEIVEHLQKQKTPFYVAVGGLMHNPCACGAYEKWVYTCNIFDPTLKLELSVHAHADSAPMAICLAFLKLKGLDKETK